MWNFLCETCLTRPRKALCLAMSSSKSSKKFPLAAVGFEPTPRRDWSLNPAPLDRSPRYHWACASWVASTGNCPARCRFLLKSCSLILFTYDKPDPKRVSACGCVAVTTSLRCIWKNRSTQNWLKLSATEPQAVNKWLLDAKPVECNRGKLFAWPWQPQES